MFAKAEIIFAIEGGLRVVHDEPDALYWIVNNWISKPIDISLSGDSNSARKRYAVEVAPRVAVLVDWHSV